LERQWALGHKQQPNKGLQDYSCSPLFKDQDMATPANERKRPEGLDEVGTPGSGIRAEEAGVGAVRQTVLHFDDTPLTITDQTSTVGYGGLKIYDFPAGEIFIAAVSVDLTEITESGGIVSDFDSDFAIGTVTASNNATLTSTEANIVQSTSVAQAVAGTTSATGTSRTLITPLTDNSGGTASDTLAALTGSYVEATMENTVASLAAKINALINRIGGMAIFDGTATPIDLFLNMLVDDADQDGGGILSLTGTITITWVNLGDR